MSGFTEGPMLAHDVAPWPLGWEWEWGWNPDERDKRKPAVRIDTCAHEWERCLLLAGPRRGRQEHVVRCRLCHVPRCGHSEDPDPCMERRHHRGLHIRLSGAFEPLGGLPDTFIDWGQA